MGSVLCLEFYGFHSIPRMFCLLMLTQTKRGKGLPVSLNLKLHTKVGSGQSWDYPSLMGQRNFCNFRVVSSLFHDVTDFASLLLRLSSFTNSLCFLSTKTNLGRFCVPATISHAGDATGKSSLRYFYAPRCVDGRQTLRKMCDTWSVRYITRLAQVPDTKSVRQAKCLTHKVFTRQASITASREPTHHFICSHEAKLEYP